MGISKCYDEEGWGDNVIDHLDESGQVSILLQPFFYEIKNLIYEWFIFFTF